MSLFGTDGVRGKANTDITPELAFQLGRGAAYVLKRDGLPDKENAIVIGKDSRLSGDMLEAGLIAGICSTGVNVYQVGLLPTPGIAVLTRMLNCMAGVVISASHNPYGDNGIKFFSPLGRKLNDETEAAIEQIIKDGLKEVPRPTGADLGRVIPYPEGSDRYKQFIKSKVDGDFSGIRVVVDCANGASSKIAPDLLRSLGADVTPIAFEPDGVNINENCGSTHLESLQKAVVKEQADLGVAYDGDADRLQAVDAEGNEVNGDQLLFLFATWLQEKGLLAENTIVGTVMTNMGLKVALEKYGIKTLATKVGDRFVIEGMEKSGAVLGGEQSGHIIFSLDNTTGDGMLSSVKLLQIMKEYKKPLAELISEMTMYPQELINVHVKNKNGWEEVQELQEAIKKGEAELKDTGRVLVRASGTENLLRVMVEGTDLPLCKKVARDIADVVEAVMA